MRRRCLFATDIRAARQMRRQRAYRYLGKRPNSAAILVLFRDRCGKNILEFFTPAQLGL